MMRDQRIRTLAKNLLDYSVRLHEGEKVLIEVIGAGVPLANALVEEAYRLGALPFVTIKAPEVNRALYLGTSEEHMKQMAAWELRRMEDIDAYIGIRASENTFELADVPVEKHRLYDQFFRKPVHQEVRVAKKKWCILRFPTPGMAQAAGMSTEAFTDFYYDVCTLDYAKMSRAMDPLVELMLETDRVRIAGPGTDLEFSIKGLPAIKCAGQLNIPDGEVFTAPVKDSVNGVISYNTASTYGNSGLKFSDIRLEFAGGKVVKATANDSEKLNGILDTDEGARYIGEFALGVNPYVVEPMNDTLFDEKIKGSLHFTPGSSYDDCYNGNKSAIHWDLVLIQRPEYGGGEIWFDDRLVRKDGQFVLPELEALNPENLA